MDEMDEALLIFCQPLPTFKIHVHIPLDFLKSKYDIKIPSSS